jgi:hypothetical protein
MVGLQFDAEVIIESKLGVWPTRRAGVLEVLVVTTEDCDAAVAARVVVAGVYLVLTEGARRHRQDYRFPPRREQLEWVFFASSR